jgi:chorismate lyase
VVDAHTNGSGAGLDGDLRRRQARTFGRSWLRARGLSRMTPETRQLAGRDQVGRGLADEDVRRLGRDLRILIASNGTLTRVLGIVADDEIVVQIVEQQVHHSAPEIPGVGKLPDGRILQRRILLKGRDSGCAFVAAETVVAIDLLPAAITTTLLETHRPIGEVMAASCLETFKEGADVWVGQPPEWLALAGSHNSEPRIVARRYRVITDGQPAIVITEYFLRNEFHRHSVM